MATLEGDFPKTGNDPVYASEINGFIVNYVSGTYIGSNINTNSYTDSGSIVLSNIQSGCLLNLHGETFIIGATGAGSEGFVQYMISGINTGVFYIINKQIDNVNSSSSPTTSSQSGDLYGSKEFGVSGIVSVPLNILVKDTNIVLKTRGRTNKAGVGVGIGPTSYNMTYTSLARNVS